MRYIFRLGAILIAGAVGTLLIGEISEAEIAFSPWTKLCVGGTCRVFTSARTNVIGEDGRAMIECGSFAGAGLIEQTGHKKITLRAAFIAPQVNSERGARVTIGLNPAIERPFKCDGDRCIADYDAGPELVDQLKQATTLVFEITDADGALDKLTFPLAGFADTYDGAQQGPKVTEKVLSSKQEMDREMLANTKRKDWCLAHDVR